MSLLLAVAALAAIMAGYRTAPLIAAGFLLAVQHLMKNFIIRQGDRPITWG